MPVYTNVHGVEEAIAQAVRRDTYDSVGDISVTGLIRPPQMAYLERVHRDEIKEDVGDGLWLLLGSVVHQVLERAQMDNVLQEERLTMEVDGWTVSGKPDLWREPSTLKDYKVTSVWAFLMGEKPDWVAQLNFYAALYRSNGFPVDKLTIAAILRDHQRSRLATKDYPPIPFMEVKIPVWSPDDALARLTERVRLHQEGREGRFGPCTDEERWAKPDVWAVKKKGNKTAMSGGLQETEKAAKEFAAKATHPTEIEFRPGENVRCAGYCDAAPWCEQWKALRPPEKGAN